MATDYPKRSSHFAHRVVRLMLKTCAMDEIGQTAFCLVTAIAHTEDAKHYKAPVSFFNDQLMSILSIRKWESLDRARRVAADAGWLHYEARGKRQSGIYWSNIPEHLQAVSDTAIDEPLYPSKGDNEGDRKNPLYPPNGYSEGDREGDRRGYREGEPPIDTKVSIPVPSPVPVPKEESAPAKAGCPSELKAWIDWWNRLRAESLVPCAAGCDPPSQAILKGWTRVRKDRALRELLADRDAIESAIRESPFCREGWFRLEKLFGSVNRDGEYIIRKLLDRGYAEKAKRNGPTIGPGQRHDPTANGANFGKF